MEASEEISKWLERYKLGEEFRKLSSFEDKWVRWEKYYRNEFHTAIIPVNLFFPLIKSLVPRVYFRDPKVIVRNRKPGYAFHARVVESLDNWLLRRLRVKRTMKRMVLHASFYGTGIGKAGFDSKYGYDPENSRWGSKFERDFIEMGVWDEDYEQYEYSEDIMPGMPWYTWVDPSDLVMPYGCRDPREAEWIIHRYVRHIDDVKSDPKYENTGDLKPTRALNTTEDKIFLNTSEQEKADLVLLYECHEAKTQRVKVFAEGHDKWLRNDVDRTHLGGIPIDFLVFNENLRSCWGVPDAQYLEPQQLELNEIRTQSRDERRMSFLRVLMKSGILTSEAREKLESGEPGAIIELNVDDIRSAVTLLTPHMTQDLFNDAIIVRQDMREIVGFSRNQMGEFDAGTRRTATEAAIVNEAASFRIDERKDAAADLLLDIVRRFNRYIFSFWDQERYAEILGPDGAMYWVSYTGRELESEYDLEIAPDSGPQLSSEKRRQDALQLLQVVLTFARGTPPEQLPFDLGGVIRTVVAQFDTIDPYVVLSPSLIQTSVQQAIPLSEMNRMAAQQRGAAGNAAVSSALSQLLLGGREIRQSRG